jgi:hypothetical protein
MSTDLSRIVSFTNITGEDFTHAYDSRPYTINAGESMLLPYDLGRHLAKHLARKILFGGLSPTDLKNDRPAFSKDSEADLIGKILGAESRRELPPQLSEAERMAQRVAELNASAPEGAPTGRTKIDVIADMEKEGLEVDKRKSMATLEEELSAHRAK